MTSQILLKIAMLKRLALISLIFFCFPPLAHASETVKTVQSILNDLGYNAGVADGISGKKTASALNQFYKSYGTTFDGSVDERELEDLQFALMRSKINTYDGSGLISEKESPNFESLRWSLYRNIHYFPSIGETFHTVEGKNSFKFPKELQKDPYVTKQINTTPLLSYLLYEDGKIVIDEISPMDRFGDMFSNMTMYHSKSMGKSITSFLVGHAICEGAIDGLDAKLDDWDVLENTLYHNQKITDFLNMTTGDQRYSDNDESPISIQKRMKTEFKGSKKSKSVYNYTNMNTNILMSYLNFKYGEEKFKQFLDNIFQNEVGIEHAIFFNKAPAAEWYEQSLAHQFFATRYDYLRIAKSMLDAWQNDTCLGKYLKEIHSRRISKNGVQGTKGRVGLPRMYAGFFHTGYKGMEQRPVLGMDGFGGQTVVIDFERNRIIATLSAFDNMRYPKKGSFDFETIVYRKLLNGAVSSPNSSKDRLIEISQQELESQHRARRNVKENQKRLWDEYYQNIFFGSLPSNSNLLVERFDSNKNLKVTDYDDNWEIKREAGNSIYCNKKKESWTEFVFGEQTWSNYSLTFRIKFLTDTKGDVEPQVRKINGRDYRAIIRKSGQNATVQLLNEMAETQIDTNEWLEIEFFANESTINFFINGNLIISEIDDNISHGGGMIAVSKNMEVCVDDIIVRKI